MEDLIQTHVHIQEARTAEDIQKCWDVMHALRPHLKQEVFVDTVREMFEEGYKLAFIEQQGKAVSAVGYRFQNFLYNGKHIYIDDLSTLSEYRGHGYAGKLLDYVSELARKKGLKKVSLDSGHQRFTAHRLYLNKGYIITSHHFECNLS
ncbi:MAG TPA: GNAT family N-acetyltransferase [Ohtaekwangia sp.]